MNSETSSLDTLKDIKKMMEKSSRFISLSGWSGIAAGVCGLAGAYWASRILSGYSANEKSDATALMSLEWSLLELAGIVFLSAFITAFIFTYLRSRQEGIAIWGQAAKRLLWNTMLPMLVGGILILRLIDMGDYSLIAPIALVFYGLALVNGSKYTLGEIRYMGYLEIILGAICLWYPNQWLIFWSLGFGALHIVYGILMWWKYERKTA
jgi:hypothetical protein